MKKIRSENGVEYLQFGNLSNEKGVIHTFSTRTGGVSGSYYKSMNLGFNRGDPDNNVTENYKLFCQALGIEPEQLVFASQTHSTIIRRVGKESKGEDLYHPVPSTGYDGLATSEEGVLLATLYADCVPLYFYDPVRKAVALSHAGWRGTLDNMAGITVRFLAKEFGSEPGDLLMGIGPSIGVCCFEVGDEVAGPFRELPAEIISGAITEELHIDLQIINRRMAIKEGVKDENIETAGICTSCNSDWLFSHRASGGERGSLCAILGIKDNV